MSGDWLLMIGDYDLSQGSMLFQDKCDDDFHSVRGQASRQLPRTANTCMLVVALVGCCDSFKSICSTNTDSHQNTKWQHVWCRWWHLSISKIAITPTQNPLLHSNHIFQIAMRKVHEVLSCIKASRPSPEGTAFSIKMWGDLQSLSCWTFLKSRGNMRSIFIVTPRI